MMKKIKIVILIAFVLGMVLVSCSEAHQAYRELNSLTQDIQKNGVNYTAGEWYAAWQQYQDVNERIKQNSDKYSFKEKKTIDRNRAICVGAFTDAALTTGSELFEKGKNIGEEVMDFWDKMNN